MPDLSWLFYYEIFAFLRFKSICLNLLNEMRHVLQRINTYVMQDFNKTHNSLSQFQYITHIHTGVFMQYIALKCLDDKRFIVGKPGLTQSLSMSRGLKFWN